MCSERRSCVLCLLLNDKKKAFSHLQHAPYLKLQEPPLLLVALFLLPFYSIPGKTVLHLSIHSCPSTVPSMALIIVGLGSQPPVPKLVTQTLRNRALLGLLSLGFQHCSDFKGKY